MNIIKSINYDQHEIIRDILLLHNNGDNIDCDITYSKGNFYGTFNDSNGNEFEIKPPTYKFDVVPLFDDVEKIEPLGKIPLEDGSIKCLMVDLPFVVTSPTAPSLSASSGNIIARRFAFYGSEKELLESYRHWIAEGYRVLEPNGIMIFKCQPIINCNTQWINHVYSCNIAEQIGFYIKDEFMLLAKSRLIGKVKNQCHSRKYHSYFYVFSKDSKLRERVQKKVAV